MQAPSVGPWVVSCTCCMPVVAVPCEASQLQCSAKTHNGPCTLMYTVTIPAWSCRPVLPALRCPYLPYPTLSHYPAQMCPALPHPTLPNCALQCPTHPAQLCPALQFPTLPCSTVPCNAPPCHALPTLPCPAPPRPALPCPALPSPAQPCPAVLVMTASCSRDASNNKHMRIATATVSCSHGHGPYSGASAGATWRVSFAVLIPVAIYLLYYRVYVLQELKLLSKVKQQNNVKG